jgi:hypothetical protein
MIVVEKRGERERERERERGELPNRAFELGFHFTQTVKERA